jgi:hypothetical protein
MRRILVGAGLALLATTSAEAACNRAYIEAAIDQRIPGWAIKFRTPDRVSNICTLCDSFEGREFRACVIEEVSAMESRAQGAARRFFGN